MSAKERALGAVVLLSVMGLVAYVLWSRSNLARDAKDDVIVEFALNTLRGASKDVVAACGTTLAGTEIEAAVTIDTINEGIEVRAAKLASPRQPPDTVACIEKALVGRRATRKGRFADSIPSGRVYELDARLVLPAITPGYMP